MALPRDAVEEVVKSTSKRHSFLTGGQRVKMRDTDQAVGACRALMSIIQVKALDESYPQFHLPIGVENVVGASRGSSIATSMRIA